MAARHTYVENPKKFKTDVFDLIDAQLLKDLKEHLQKPEQFEILQETIRVIVRDSPIDAILLWQLLPTMKTGRLTKGAMG